MPSIDAVGFLRIGVFRSVFLPPKAAELWKRLFEHFAD